MSLNYRNDQLYYTFLLWEMTFIYSNTEFKKKPTKIKKALNELLTVNL